MAENKKDITFGKIGNALKSVAANHVTAFAEDVFDENRQEYQSEINQTLQNEIEEEANRAKAAEEANAADIAEETARAKAAEEANTQAIAKRGIYDVSAYNDGAVFESLSALLNHDDLSTLIPTSVRCGGMSIRFIQGSVQNSDNKYVQYRLMSETFNTTAANWQGVDNEPTAESKNLVNSGGVYKEISQLGKKIWLGDNSIFKNKQILLETGEVINSELYRTTDYIALDKCSTINIKLWVQTDAAVLAFYDDNLKFISCINGVGVGSATPVERILQETDIPSNARFIKCSTYIDRTSISFVFTNSLMGISTMFSNLVKQEINNLYFIDRANLFKKEVLIYTDGKVLERANYLSTEYIPIDGLTSIQYKKLYNIESGNVISFYSLPNPNGYISGIAGEGVGSAYAKSGEIEIGNIPEGAKYIRFSTYISRLSQAFIKMNSLLGISSLIGSIVQEMDEIDKRLQKPMLMAQKTETSLLMYKHIGGENYVGYNLQYRSREFTEGQYPSFFDNWGLGQPGLYQYENGEMTLIGLLFNPSEAELAIRTKSGVSEDNEYVGGSAHGFENINAGDDGRCICFLVDNQMVAENASFNLKPITSIFVQQETLLYQAYTNTNPFAIATKRWNFDVNGLTIQTSFVITRILTLNLVQIGMMGVYRHWLGNVSNNYLTKFAIKQNHPYKIYDVSDGWESNETDLNRLDANCRQITMYGDRDLGFALKITGQKPNNGNGWMFVMTNGNPYNKMYFNLVSEYTPTLNEEFSATQTWSIE